MYDWVNQSNPKIVGVSMGYRLNVLGFLSGSEVKANGDVNVGLLDQRAAIEWVQRHISKFGGDPDSITIAGESAGGASVLMQIVAYGGKTFDFFHSLPLDEVIIPGKKPVPFQRAIAQSIGYGPTANASLAQELFGKCLYNYQWFKPRRVYQRMQPLLRDVRPLDQSQFLACEIDRKSVV